MENDNATQEKRTENFKSMAAEDYLSQRLDQYISWYDKKLVKMKSKFLNMRAGSVTGVAIVPVLLNVSIDFINNNYHHKPDCGYSCIIRKRIPFW